MKLSPLTAQSRLVLETLKGILIQLTDKGVITAFHCELEEMSGLSHLRPLGAYWYDLFKPVDDRTSGREFFFNEVLQGNAERHINWVDTRAGKRLFIEWRFKRIENPSGGITCLIGIGQTVARRIANETQLTMAYDRLIEQNKELTCLYGISRIIVDAGPSFDDKLASIIQLMPPAMRYPRRASAHIRLDGVSHHTPGFGQADKVITERVVVRDEERGCVEAGYRLKDQTEDGDDIDFTDKERQLLATVARQLAFKLEKRELQEQLKHTDRLVSVGQLAAGIAHELNNPLADILGFAQLAAKRADLPEETYQDLVRIVRSSLYAREVIKRILLFSRQSRPQETETNLNAIVEEWLDFIEFRCAKNNINVSLDLAPELPTILGDPAQLNQVLVNLVINAIHAMTDGGRLTIRTGIKDNQIFLLVQDTGTGIAPEIRDKIFLPFFTTKEVDQGTGLGLPVVYGIVQEHGGTVLVQSKQGKGATFEVRLPITRKMAE